MEHRSTLRGAFVLAASMMLVVAGSAFATVDIDFESHTPGDSAEGWGAVHPLLNISDWELGYDAVVIAEGGAVRSYSASAGVNGCLIDDQGLGWAVDNHPEGHIANPPDRDYWEFDLSDDVAVLSFSLVLLDYGDYYSEAGRTTGTATMTAYNHNHVAVATDAFTASPKSSVYDACATGGLGEQTLAVDYAGGIDYVRVSFDGVDEGIGFDNISFSYESPTTSCAASDVFVSAVGPGSATPEETEPLVAGHLYDLTAYGTFYAGGATKYDIRADAEYSEDTYQRANGLAWTDSVRNYESYGEELLELLVGIGGPPAPVEWGVYNAAHEYSMQVLGTGSPAEFAFQIYDIYAQNNTGGLCVSVDFINRPPVADANGPYMANEGDTVVFDGSGSSDPDADALTYSWMLNPDDGPFNPSAGVMPTHGFVDDYVGTINLTVDDGYGATASASASVTIANVPPTIGSLSVTPTLIAVGESVAASATFTDPGTADTHTASWEWGDGTTPGTVTQGAGSGSVNDTHTYSAAGVYTVALTVTDNDGGADTEQFQYVIVYDPSAGFVTGGGWIDSPAGAFYPSDLPFFDGSYYELVPVDPWMYWDDADAAANAMSIGACQSAHLATITSAEEQAVLTGLMAPLTLNAWIGGYQEADELGTNDNWKWVTGEAWGPYTNWAGGEPNDNPWGTPTDGSEQHLEAYQGSGLWNDAPGDPLGILGGETKSFYIVEYEGCDLPTGKATFGFVSKYKKGAEVPTGSTEFQFHAAGLNFHSSSYDWLVVTGSDFAKFKGVGTINGEGEYKFQIWAGDDDPDTFRIKIWTEVGGVETVIYDNGMNQPINGGSIIVHTKKK